MTTQLKTSGNSEAMIIGNNIRSLMDSYKVSEAQLARSLNVSLMTIRRVISGETEDPRISTLSQIANYFKVSVDSLLEKSEMPISLKTQQKPFFVPIFDWKMLEKYSFQDAIDLSQWKNWYPLVNNDVLQLNKEAFALESKSSLQPRFPIGTLFIVNPHETPLDRDILLLRSLKTKELFLRELIIDHPKWLLYPIIAGSELIFYNKQEYDIIGVIVLTTFHARE